MNTHVKKGRAKVGMKTHIKSTIDPTAQNTISIWTMSFTFNHSVSLHASRELVEYPNNEAPSNRPATGSVLGHPINAIMILTKKCIRNNIFNCLEICPGILYDHFIYYLIRFRVTIS
jgi:hypothetical protein